MKQVSQLGFRHRVNDGVLKYLQGDWNLRPEPIYGEPDEVLDPKAALGTHPELLDWLWNTICAKLPKDCRKVIYGKPVLIHPETGVIFGLGHGECVCALRLPLDKVGEAIMSGMEDDVELENGQELYSEDIGDDWVFCTWTEDDPDWCLRAYENAGSMREV